ncbi:DNA-binding response regulator [Psychrobacillus glaciei]|uniref:Heme response regulator HssR n=1 Tax=Psychrobacillus glaciei TaxID=2283160 RepID=A0A5J6SL66_9BACI|nr:response regulator transcription factor [Psychrobacillus glaciei]QFF98412.1 DNA-binding response regulator [Psychrobacillus glaciei]
MINILVTEDDRNIRRLIREYLLKAGYNVFDAEDGSSALKLLDKHHIDLLITDIMMPSIDGLELTVALRNSGFDLPILMITALESFKDKKNGFYSGADDYLVKPIDMEELVLRVSALLRRAKIANDKKLEYGDIVLHYEQYTVVAKDATFELPKKEFQLLYKLLSQPKKIFTRQQLMDEIWGFDTQSDIRTVDVHIKRIREKLAEMKEFEIVTVRGLGYKVEKKR